MSRSRILNRIRYAGREACAPALPREIPSFPSYSDPIGEFVEQASRVDIDVERVQNISALREALHRVLLDTGVETFFWESPEIFEQHGISHRFRDPAGFGSGKLLTSFHFRSQVDFPLVLNTRPFKRAAVAAIELAVVHGKWGVAETGTIGLQVQPGKSRTLPMLPPKVLVLLRAQDIASNLSEIFDQYDPSSEGSILTLMTGPSRTADIEKTLVIGVHGPGQVYVVITDFN